MVALPRVPRTTDSAYRRSGVTPPSPPTTGNPYHIAISYSGDPTYQTYFNQAAATLEKIITADLPNMVMPDGTVVDDLLIQASVTAIDGVGNTLAQAGPTDLRGGSNLPYYGIMEFDIADIGTMVSSGTFGDVVMHEMAHVMGFGTLWGYFGFNATVGQYTGTNALREYRNLSGNAAATYVPLETGGGAGTQNVHWSEAVFKTELMTGYAEPSGNMPLSRMTVGSFQDLGYQVDYTQAEAYTLPVAIVGVQAAAASTAGAASATLTHAALLI